MDRSRKRSGAVVLEAIIGLPVLIIALMAIVEFGMLSSNQAIVHAASRAAADAAAAVSLPTSGAVPTEISNAATKVLDARGIGITCVRVEHTADLGGSTTVLLSGSGANNPTSPRPTDAYVAVTVCVENTQLAPNLLSIFKLDLSGSYSQHTTFRCVARDCQ